MLMKKLYAVIAAAMATLPFVASAEEITIFPDATGTSTFLPLNIYYCSNNIHTQMIYPASELEALKGKVITKITYTVTRASGAWTAPSVTVKMGTTTQTTYEASDYITDGLAEVATLENLSIGVPTTFPATWEIAFDHPFTYTGDNLVVDFTNVKGNGPRYWTFQGENQTENTGISMASSANLQKFLPKMVVEYEDASAVHATLSTTSINFALQFVDEEVTSTIRLTNTGSEALSGSFSVDNELFSVEPAEVSELAAGESAEITVNFSPTETGSFKGNLVFTAEGLDPMNVALSGTAVDGPSAHRYIFNANYYATVVPAGWNAYAEELVAATNEFSAGTTEYDQFGTSMNFDSKTVDGFGAIVWDHANDMPYTESYIRAYYLVSPLVGSKMTFGATAVGVAAVGPYVKAYKAVYNTSTNLFEIGDEIELTFDTPLAQGEWSNVTADIPQSTYVALKLKYAALDYFAADKSTVGVESVTENGVNAPIEYFNLQGMRVANPASGLYITRQGTTVKKVVIR